MSIIRFLFWLQQIEFKMKRIYQWLSVVLVSDPEACCLFQQVSNDKSSYHHHLKSAIHRTLNDRSGIDRIETDPAQMESLLASLDDFQQAHPVPSLQQALEFAISAESDRSRFSLADTISPSNPCLGNLVKNIERFGQVHFETLFEFAFKRKIPIPNAQFPPASGSQAGSLPRNFNPPNL